MWFRGPTDDLQSFNVLLHAAEPEVRGHLDLTYIQQHIKSCDGQLEARADQLQLPRGLSAVV